MPPPRLRFAPSPTGPLHLGSAVVAVANALAARSLGGELVLRIDDTDAERTVAEAEQGILDDLAWLGLELTGEPVRQSERRELHSPPRSELLATAHAYRCFCPPSQERYDGRCRALPRAEAERRHEAGEPNVIRFRVPGAPRSSWRTPRAARCASPATRSPTSCSCGRTGGPTFDLATSVDDRDLAITHIVRGEDHLANSARHLLLLRALGAVEPVFAHCPIIVGADGERLSARRGAEPLAALRARGVPPEAVVAYAAQLACPAQGGASEVASFEELAAALLARAPRARHRARRSRRTSHGSAARCWPACRSEELARRLAAFLPRGTPAAVLARARRGGARRSGARRGRKLCCGAWHSDPAGRSAGAPALELFCELREADRARSPALRGRRRARRSAARARRRPAASRPATCYTP